MEIKKRNVGYGIVLFIVLITFVLWLGSKPSLLAVFDLPFKSLGQIAGLMGLVLLSLQYVLAARFVWIERMFGGLDKVYKAHRLLGVLGFLFILYHPFFLALNVLPSVDLFSRYFLPLTSNSLAYNMGIVSLYGYLALVALTVYVKLPYHVWKKTHEWIGVPLFFAIWHVLTIYSDVSNSWTLRAWVVSVSFLGAGAFLYKLYLYPAFARKYEYLISSISQKGQITELVLVPCFARMDYLPGQFAFLTFKSSALSLEPHPFTISSAPQDSFLRFSIKNLGDFTARVGEVRPGDKVSVQGPYGVFGEASLAFHHKDQVWIAGGIGITPFLSMLRYYAEEKNAPRISLFCVVKNESEDVYSTEVVELARKHPDRISVYSYYSDKEGIMTAKRLGEMSGTFVSKKILLCGPPGMMNSLSDQFVKLGVPSRQIAYEDFSFFS